MMTYAGAKLQHVHVADCFNHRANIGNRYIINPPGVDARIHQHNEIGNGEVDWAEFFGALRDLEFDGIATVCVFGWEEHADDIHRRMLEPRDGQELRVVKRSRDRAGGYRPDGPGAPEQPHRGSAPSPSWPACTTPTRTGRRAVAAEYGVPAARTFDELVERSEAVAIATPTGSHAELTVAAAQAGRPVFCEKPLSLDRATTVATDRGRRGGGRAAAGRVPPPVRPGLGGRGGPDRGG